jgi:hypothetical protein
MEKGHETSVTDKIEKKDADYTGYSEKQADLNLDKGFKSSQMTAQTIQKVSEKKKKVVTVFQKEDVKEE